MCTVTYRPISNGFYLCSNRDEYKIRKKASSPQYDYHNGVKLLFPKDGAAGGTWIAVNQHGWVMVLLNGAFEKHIPNGPYHKSRGLIALDIIANLNPVQGFLNIPLIGIEPFTIILAQQNRLYECRWDGVLKSKKPLDPKQNYIWSSVTLYSTEVIASRELFFQEYCRKHPEPNSPQLLNFHQFKSEENNESDIQINRQDMLLTLSISCLMVEESKAVFEYIDILEQETTRQTIELATNFHEIPLEANV